jgi:hypothetical protein
MPGGWSSGLIPVVRGALHGMTLSTAGSSATFSVAAGQACDSSFTDMMTLAASISKTTAAWAVGGGNGGLDTGAIANSTWYHAHAIKRVDTSVVDALVSLSPTAPTLPGGYSLARRIGSMRTNASGQWTAFSQFGDEFIWLTTVADANGVALSLTPRTLFSLTIPTGITVNALFRAAIDGSTNQNMVSFFCPDETDQAPGGAGAGIEMVLQAASQFAGGRFNVRSNLSGQIAARGGGTNPTLYLNTFGWIDPRGRYA